MEHSVHSVFDVRVYNGEQLEPESLTYTGTFERGVPDGHGTLMHGYGSTRDNDEYSGQWFQGRIEGHGRYLSRIDAWDYCGEWCDGMWHGHGVLTYCDDQFGYRYIGEWQRNRRHGQGRVVRVESACGGVDKWEQMVTAEWVDDVPRNFSPVTSRLIVGGVEPTTPTPPEWALGPDAFWPTLPAYLDELAAEWARTPFLQGEPSDTSFLNQQQQQDAIDAFDALMLERGNYMTAL